MLVLLLPAALAAPERAVTLGYNRGLYMEYWTWSERPALELAGTWRVDPGLEATVGARRLFSADLIPARAWDLYAAGRAAPALWQGSLGRWTPSVGLELGLTGALQRNSAYFKENSWALERDDVIRHDVGYLAFLLDPIHGRLGPVSGSVGALSLGTTLPHWGDLLRAELTLARLGVAW